MAFWLIGRISNSHWSHLGSTPGFSTLWPIQALHPWTVNELVRSYDASVDFIHHPYSGRLQDGKSAFF